MVDDGTVVVVEDVDVVVGAVVVVVGAFPVETIISTAEFGAAVLPAGGLVASTVPCGCSESW